MQDIRILAGKFLGAVQGAMCALADAIGITIEDETALEDGLDQIAQGVMHDAVAKGRGRDQAALRFMDMETVIGSGTIRMRLQFALQLQEIIFQAVVKRGDVGVSALAFACFLIGEKQIAP